MSDGSDQRANEQKSQTTGVIWDSTEEPNPDPPFGVTQRRATPGNEKLRFNPDIRRFPDHPGLGRHGHDGHPRRGNQPAVIKAMPIRAFI